VECLWIGSAAEPILARPVRPDGCIDIVYSRENGLQVVGAMTVQRCFDMAANSLTAGIRFRPGMAGPFIGMAAAELTDRIVSFDHATERRLSSAGSSEEILGLLSSLLRTPENPPGSVQRAIAAMAHSHGQADLDWIADQSNLSTRQFRRRCLDEAGLTPRHLCRVLRFRNAHTLASQMKRPNWAAIAADAGYYDQAHLIRDFREFTGGTPMSVFSNIDRALAG
jgi:AraC-like DNA-binding protein